MAITTVPYRLSYRDAKGFVGTFHTWITSDTTSLTLYADIAGIAQGIRTAVNALTNAALQSDSGLPADNNAVPPVYGTNAEYPAEWMKAVMTFSDGDGNLHRFKVPAPKITIFDTDGVTVLNDGTQAAVVAFISAMKAVQGAAFPSSKSGIAFTNFLGGILRLGKQPRRFNELIKSSHLVQGEGE